MQDIAKYVFGEAAKSNVEKRQVGCIITCNQTGARVGFGFNTEDVHAERMACESLMNSGDFGSALTYTAYVSHQPCPECALLLADYNVTHVEIVERFMKFDGDKLRYDLLPPVPIEEVVKVLTDGARKYKPDNWRECEDTGRYEAALMRHFEAYRKGEWLDPDSGSPHLAHAMCNLVFLLELEAPEKLVKTQAI